MRPATATYRGLDGKEFTVAYDRDDPCWLCEMPVEAASVGGTAICPWCDTGRHRDGHEVSFREAMERSKNYKRHLVGDVLFAMREGLRW